MKLEVDRETIEYIKQKGSVANVDLYTSSSCCGGVTEPTVKLETPKLLHQFDEYVIEDVKIYVSKFIHLRGEVLGLSLRKFLGIKTISVSGVKML